MKMINNNINQASLSELINTPTTCLTNKVKKISVDKFYIINFSDDFLEKSLTTNSAINFYRYIEYLYSYSKDRELFMDVDGCGNLMLRISSTLSEAYMSLIFNQNGVVEFLSLEKGYSKQDKDLTPYYLKGSMETSENFDYAYKIGRLLAILDGIHKEVIPSVKKYINDFEDIFGDIENSSIIDSYKKKKNKLYTKEIEFDNECIRMK